MRAVQRHRRVLRTQAPDARRAAPGATSPRGTHVGVVAPRLSRSRTPMLEAPMLLSLLVSLACGGDDSTSTQTSDMSGRLTSIERSDAMGNVWGRFTYTYDADGHLTQLFDGDNRTAYRYNREGRLVSRIQESRVGMPIVCTWSWTTTATGADYDEDCMGYRASGSVDTRGLETFRVIYDRTSGDPASETTKVWRTNCQPLSEATDRLLGGTDSSLAYAYDANGRQTGLVSESASGTLNATSSFTCPAQPHIPASGSCAGTPERSMLACPVVTYFRRGSRLHGQR